MALKLAEGVSLRGLRPEITFALQAAERVYSRFATDCIVTSGTDGRHSEGSLHYVGLAVDLRTRNLSEPNRERVASLLRECLSGEYDVVLESTHIHVEFQPKQPLNG